MPAVRGAEPLGLTLLDTPTSRRGSHRWMDVLMIFGFATGVRVPGRMLKPRVG